MSAAPLHTIPAGLEVVLQLGFGVFPCRDRTIDDDYAAKAPLTEHGKNDATDVPRQIEAWARQFPRCAWGARPPLDITVLDIDVKTADGFATLKGLEAKHAPLPATLTNKTVSGGEHMLFRTDGKTVFKNRAGIRPGLDVRSNGGYIIVPPSYVDDGKYAGNYAWADASVPVAEAPDWLVSEVFAYEQKKRKIGAQPDGARNDGMYRFACSLRGKSFDYDAAWALMLDENRKCVPPLGERELRGRLDSAWTHPAGPSVDLSGYAGAHPDIVDELRTLAPDVLVLPNDYVPAPIAAKRIFETMGRNRELFVRGDQIVELAQNQNVLKIVDPTAFRSRLHGRQRRIKHVVQINNGKDLVLKYRHCSEDNARLLLKATEAERFLPPIQLVSSSAVLAEHEGRLVVLGEGYHEVEGGVLVFSKQTPPDVPLVEAVNALLALLKDFHFTDGADKSRAVVNLVAPCIRMGRFIDGYHLINCVEGDDSQAGKGLLLSLPRAIHNAPTRLVTQKKDGGVGSLTESIADALVGGTAFVTLDNIRGKIDNEFLEMLVTTNERVPARIPNKGTVLVDTRRTVFQLSSNGYESTVDLGNRSMMTRLKKRSNYIFPVYPERGGGLLDHVLAQHNYYLGCVFAVVREWFGQGKPMLPTSHSFREWIGTLDYIAQKIFDLPPILDGHKEAISRISNPGLTWLRQIAVVVIALGRVHEELSATTLGELSEDANIVVPHAQNSEAHKAIGKHMKQCFGKGNELFVDDIKVTRIETSVYNEKREGYLPAFRYVFAQKNGAQSGEM